MTTQQLPLRSIGLGLMVLGAALLRLVAIAPNVSPIAAMALFAGFSFRHRLAAFAFPLVALVLSDLVIGTHDLMWVVYASFALTSVLAIFLRDQKGAGVKALVAFTGSVLFFVITNFAVWAQGGMYPVTFDGLVECYIAGLPFFDNAVIGDLFFSAVLFGGWALAERMVPELKAATVSAK
jgi:hypothetical protein